MVVVLLMIGIPPSDPFNVFEPHGCFHRTLADSGVLTSDAFARHGVCGFVLIRITIGLSDPQLPGSHIGSPVHAVISAYALQQFIVEPGIWPFETFSPELLRALSFMERKGADCLDITWGILVIFEAVACFQEVSKPVDSFSLDFCCRRYEFQTCLRTHGLDDLGPILGSFNRFHPLVWFMLNFLIRFIERHQVFYVHLLLGILEFIDNLRDVAIILSHFAFRSI